MNKPFPLAESIDDALTHSDKVTRYMLLDSLSCYLHNEWATLEGNKEQDDIEWLARNFYKSMRGEHWDAISDDAKKHYLQIAECAIDLIPAVQERMAARYLALSTAMKSYIKMQKAAGKLKSTL